MIVIYYVFLGLLASSNGKFVFKTWDEMRSVLDSKMEKEYNKTFMEGKSIRWYTKDCMKGVTVRVVVFDKLPYVSVEKTPKEIILKGYIGEIWSTLEKFLGFKTIIKIENPDDERKLLRRNPTYDMILVPIVMKSSDLNDFSHTTPVAFTWYQLFVNIDVESGSSRFYVSIWKSWLWSAFFSTICFLSIYLWLANLVKDFTSDVPERKKLSIFSNSFESDSSLINCFLCILGAMTNQGIQIQPKSLSMRIVIITTIVFGLVMSTSYSAILISKLATKGKSIPNINELNEILNQDRYSLCVSTRSMAYRHFKNNSSDLPGHWSHVLNRPPCNVSGKNLVPAKDYCYKDTIVLESFHDANYVLNNNLQKCPLETLPHRYFYSYITVLTRKDFYYTELISRYLLKFHSAGILSKIQQEWLPVRYEKKFELLDYEYRITYEHIRSVLIIYLIVNAISLFILLIEFVVFKWFDRKTK